MSEQRRGPVLPDNSPIRTKRPVSQSRPVSRSTSSRSSSSRSSSSRSYSERSYSDRNRSYSSQKKGGNKKRKLKSSFYFLTFMAIWIVLILIFGIIFLAYADRSLKKFEKSQSTYAMDEYVKKFKDSVSQGVLPEGFTSEAGSAFEADDLKLQSLQNATAGAEITYQQNKNSYNTEEPIYDLLASGTPFATVQLQATNSRVVFGILTIMDWNVVEAKMLSNGSTSDYIIRVPEGYSVTVNGISVGSEYITGSASDMAILANAVEYVDIPEIVEYTIPGLSKAPEVSVSDTSGNSVATSVDGNTYSVGFGESGEMPSELVAEALNIAETWSLFMTADLTGNSHGLAKVQEFLIPGSAYDDMAKGWASGVDITFTSAHTLKNPAFENVVIDEYISYTPDCFSCHISFNKPMYLTRTGETVVDTTDSTFVFVKYDGKWCLADMQAKVATD